MSQTTTSRVARSAGVGWRQASGLLQRLGKRDCKSVHTHDTTDAIEPVAFHRPAQSKLSSPPHQQQLSAAPKSHGQTRSNSNSTSSRPAPPIEPSASRKANSFSGKRPFAKTGLTPNGHRLCFPPQRRLPLPVSQLERGVVVLVSVSL
jgi:hypothetical protein